MSNQKNLINYLKSKKKHSLELATPVELVKLTGNLEYACFLGQAIYWSDKTKRTDGWFYKTDNDWQSELGLSRTKLVRIRKNLKKYIQTKVIKANGAPTIHYKVNLGVIYEDLEKLWSESGTIKEPNKQAVISEKEQIDLHKSNESEISENDKSDSSEINKSLTYNTQRLQHTLEQNQPLLTSEENALYSGDASEFIDYEPHYEPGVYELIENRLKEIFNQDKLKDKDLEKIREIACFVNLIGKEVTGWNPERIDLGYIYVILDWADKKVKSGCNLRISDVINALINRNKLEEYRANRKYQKDYEWRQVKNGSSPSDYYEEPYALQESCAENSY